MRPRFSTNLRIIYLVSLLLLCLRVLLAVGSKQSYVTGNTTSISGRVEREKIEQGEQVIRVDGTVVYAPVYPRVFFGDYAQISGEIVCPEKQPLCSSYYIKATQLSVIKNPNHSLTDNLTLNLEKFRAELTSSYSRFLPLKAANLLEGIVFGGGDLDPQFKNDLAKVGLSHVVAASGMNVTLVAGGIFVLLSGVGWRPIYKAILGCIVIWFYCALAGFESSVVRAGVMGSFAIAYQTMGRGSSSWFGLIVAAYIMLWVKPLLIFDYGFLLSFASMIGQISVSRVKFRLPILLKVMAQSILQNVAAVLATFPIVVTLFDRFSLVTIFTNLLLVWTVEPLMILGAAAGIVGIISQTLAGYILIPTQLLLEYFLYVSGWFSGLSWAAIEVTNLGLVFILGYYLFWGSFVYVFVIDRKRST